MRSRDLRSLLPEPPQNPPRTPLLAVLDVCGLGVRWGWGHAGSEGLDFAYNFL